jgi:hypothetical protein
MKKIDYKSKKTTLDIAVEWFKSVFIDVMYEEGWNICLTTSTRYNTIFVYQLYVTKIDADDITYNNILKIPAEYGWITNEHDIIIEFDVNKLTRNKHLLTGKELGLL